MKLVILNALISAICIVLACKLVKKNTQKEIMEVKKEDPPMCINCKHCGRMITEVSGTHVINCSLGKLDGIGGQFDTLDACSSFEDKRNPEEVKSKEEPWNKFEHEVYYYGTPYFLCDVDEYWGPDGEKVLRLNYKAAPSRFDDYDWE